MVFYSGGKNGVGYSLLKYSRYLVENVIKKFKL